MKVTVMVFDKTRSATVPWNPANVIRTYDMDHDDPKQRRVLGEQCRNAFEAGQAILTFPEKTAS